jgi:hypothetical protein
VSGERLPGREAIPILLLAALVVVLLILLFGRPQISTIDFGPNCTPLPSGRVCEGV